MMELDYRNIHIGIADSTNRTWEVRNTFIESGYQNISTEIYGPKIPYFVETDNPNLLVLGDRLAGVKGYPDLVKSIKGISDIPILFIGSKEDPKYMGELVDAGVDRFISHPFSSTVFMAQTKALLRRVYRGSVDDIPTKNGDLTIDPVTKYITLGENIIHLTPSERRLLNYLARNVGVVKTTNEIIVFVLGVEPDFQSRSGARTLIHRLRSKFGETGSKEKQHYIVTKDGVGFYMPRIDKNQIEG